MEVSFEGKFKDKEIMLRRLSEEERWEFYDTKKHVVVVIETTNSDGNIYRGAGVFVGTGLILTSSLLAPKGFKSNTFFWLKEHGDQVRGELQLIKTNEKWGLALLKPTNANQECHYAKLGHQKCLTAGMEVFCISHPDGLTYSFLIGQVVFDGDADGICRRVTDVRLGTEDNYEIFCGRVDTSVSRMENELDNDLCLIQINDIHGFKGTLHGSPVFDPRGRVVGICSFYKGKMDYAIHVSKLVEFCKGELSNSKSRGKKMIHHGDSSKSITGGKKRGRQ